MVLSHSYGDLIWPQIVLNVNQRVTGCNVFPAGFWSWFGPVAFCPPISPFWNGNVYTLYHYMSEVLNFLSTGLVFLKSQRKFWIRTFQH